MAKVPTVAIVGRPTVGKSALFNRLLRRRIAIVHDQPGVTRDRLAADFQLDDRRVTLIDTGGIGGAIGDSFEDQVQAEAQLAMQMADTIIFVTDGAAGINPIDRFLAKELRKTRKPILVAVNKIDHPKHELLETEFSQLGFEQIFPVSAEHGRGILELTNALQPHLLDQSPLENGHAHTPKPTN